MGYISDNYSNNNAGYTWKAEKPEYKKAGDLFKDNGADKVYTLRALYIANKGEYPHPVAATDPNILIDLSASLMDQVKTWRADKVLTDLINKGLVGFKIYSYESKKYGKKICYSIELLDLDDLPFPME